MRIILLFRQGMFYGCFLGLALLTGSGCNSPKNNTKSQQSRQQNSPDQNQAGNTPGPSELAKDLSQLMRLAENQNSQGKFNEALSTWRTIHLKVSQRFGTDAWQTISAEHAMNAARQRVAMSAKDREQVIELAKLTSNAAHLIAEQKYHEAQIDIENAAGISVRLWGKESYVSANVNFVRAQCYLGLGLHARAIAVLNDVLNLRIKLTGVNNPYVEATLALIATSSSNLKDYAAAQQSLEKLVEISKSLWGHESALYANRCNDLAVAYHNDGKSALALTPFEIAHTIRGKLHGPDSLQVGHIQLNRGMAFMQVKNYLKSKSALEDAYRIFHQHKLTKKDSSWPTLLDQLGTVSLIQNDNRKGQKYFSELTEFWKQRENESHLEYGKSLFKLSVSLGNQKKYQDAEPKMKQAIAIFESKLGSTNQLLSQPKATYARLLKKMGINDEPGIIRDRAVQPASFSELPN
ncbi:MAG: tetratricopeptide repeat protein [Planctomycetota bacterium]|nr:tetratricopeptide repeat protein [Planctomycetota bacterium]